MGDVGSEDSGLRVQHKAQPGAQGAAVPLSSDDCMESGWACLLQGLHDEAFGDFEAALLAAPGSDDARDGLLEALKARFRPYQAMQYLGARLYRVFRSDGTRLPQLSLWFVLGFPGVLVSIIRKFPESGRFLWPVLILFYACLVLIQVIDACAVLLARTSEQGQWVVRKGDLAGGVMVLSFMTATIAMSILFTSVNHYAALTAAFVFFMSAAPMEQACQSSPGWVRRVLITFAALVTGLGVAVFSMMWVSCEGEDWSAPIPQRIGICFLGFLLALFIFTPTVRLVSWLFGSTSR